MQPDRYYANQFNREPSDRERRFALHLRDALPCSDEIIINAHLTRHNNWRIDVTLDKPDGFCDPLAFRGYFPDESIKRIEKWYLPRLEKLNTMINGLRLVALYRRSGIIPSIIGKRHSKLMQIKFSNDIGAIYVNKDIQNYIGKLSAKYVRFYGKCPHCGERGFTESILGYECNHCRAIWEDIFINQLQWYLGVKDEVNNGK